MHRGGCLGTEINRSSLGPSPITTKIANLSWLFCIVCFFLEGGG